MVIIQGYAYQTLFELITRKVGRQIEKWIVLYNWGIQTRNSEHFSWQKRRREEGLVE
jgi:hypothetical protein